MIIFSFCIFIWILTRSSSNIASIKFRFTRSCQLNRTQLKISITQLIDFWIFCRILLTDERMNCYCCLSKMNEKFSLLYRKSSSFIYLLIFHFLIHRDSSENRDLRLSREFFFWSSYLRSSLSLRSDFIRIAYSSSNSLISRRSRKSINLKEIISIEWL
jgi:hypothetical protein